MYDHDERENDSNDEDGTSSLPVFIPLSHDNEHLSADTFNVEEFLLSRSFTSLPDLQSELRDYLVTLKEELVKLINDDYEAFISLSTDLRGEGVRLERLRRPLANLKFQVLESRRELQVIQDAIQEKLKKRATLREEKALLHLLLKISDSVTRLESLLHISSPVEDITSSPKENALRISVHLSSVPEDDANVDEKLGNHAKHLGRVAAEYTQLLYHTSKARADKCAFMDELQWRVDRIQSTLSSDLDNVFASTLISLTRNKPEGKPTEIDKAKWTTDLTECLRTYDVLGLWGDAEDVLRREVVRAFVKKTIFPGALAAPHSPIVPHTPFPNRASHFSFPPATAPNPNLPHTPYTPFSAFASKQNPFRVTSRSPQAHLLDDSEDNLARVYNQILRFVERDLSRVMDIAEKVSVASGSGPRAKVLDKGTAARDGSQVLGKMARKEGFEIMANVVWEEVGKAIMDELGNVVFAAGRPNEFRKHYETTRAFIRSLEFLAPSVHSVEVLRSHSVYVAFDKRWQLPVYFQLRWKEIVTKVENSLSVTSAVESISNEKNAFATAQGASVWTAILSCWSAEIYIPELGHRFWKLTLQLLSRYKTWLNTYLPAFDTAPKISAGLVTDPSQISAPPASSRSTTPVLPTSESLSAENNAADDMQLRQWAAAIVDITTMRAKVLTLWREEINMMLPDIPNIGDDDVNGAHPEDALRHALSTLTFLIPSMSSQIVGILTRRSCDALLPVRSIPSQFRAMSNKRMPTEPSYFVASILRPVKNFFAIGTGDGPGEPLKKDFLRQYATDVFENASQRYIYYLTAMKKTEESLRRLKKGRQAGFSLFGSGSPAPGGSEGDEERIRVQMILDVELFGKDAKSLSVDLDASEGFKALDEMVRANPSDDF